MIIEIRVPLEGELWWNRNSVQQFEGYRDGLYLYTTAPSGRPYMFRCYGSAGDLRDVMLPPQFASVDRGRSVDVKIDELVRGDWVLAAEQEKVAEFLRAQVEEYRQLVIQEVNDEVALMVGVIELGKNPDDVPPPWIRSKGLVSFEGM